MRRASDFGSLGWNSRTILAQSRRAGAQLRHLHEEVHADRPEERQARGEGVDVEADLAAAADVLDAVGQGVGELEVGGRAGFLHMVAGNADRVELGHVLRRVGEDVRHDPHRGCGREDVGVADHELLEDVVLDGPAQLLGPHALLFGGEDVEGQHRQDRAVHGHRHAHLVERDAVEQDLHVQDRIDGDPGHPDIAGDAGVVAVVAAVGGEVEGDRQALLPGGEVAPVEGVAVLGRGEAGILPDRPGLGRVHGGVGAAQVGRQAWPGVQEIQTGRVGGGVERRDGDALGGLPGQCLRWVAGLGGEGGAPSCRVGCAGWAQRQVGEARDLAHAASPASAASVRSRVARTSAPACTNSSTPAACQAARCVSSGRPIR